MKRNDLKDILPFYLLFIFLFFQKNGPVEHHQQQFVVVEKAGAGAGGRASAAGRKVAESIVRFGTNDAIEGFAFCFFVLDDDVDTRMSITRTIPEPIEMTGTHRNDGQSCHIRHENFNIFEMFSTPTGSCIRHENFGKIQDVFDPDGQLDSIAPPARSNPTARQGRKHLEFFKIFMSNVTWLSVLSMGSGMPRYLRPSEKFPGKIRRFLIMTVAHSGSACHPSWTVEISFRRRRAVELASCAVGMCPSTCRNHVEFFQKSWQKVTGANPNVFGGRNTHP